MKLREHMLNEREVVHTDKKGNEHVLEYEGKDGAIVNHDPQQARDIHCTYCGKDISFDKKEVHYGNISKRHVYTCKDCTGFKTEEERKKAQQETKKANVKKPVDKEEMRDKKQERKKEQKGKLRELLLNETQSTKMPLKQFRQFKEISAEFKAGHKGYKYTSIDGFMRDLEKDDYKSLSVLFNDLGVGSIDEFVRKYKDYVDKVNESADYGSPQDKAKRDKLAKVIRLKPGGRAEYAHAEYVVELIGKSWPKEYDIIWFADYPGGAPFGGRVVDSKDGKTKYVSVHTD